MSKYFVIFVMFVLCLFALMYILGGEWVERIGCCEETMLKKQQATSETDELETAELAPKRIMDKPAPKRIKP